MSGTVFISTGTSWGTQSRVFLAIVERIRSGYIESGEDAPEELFSPLDSDLDFISLEELSRDDFRKFVAASESQLNRLLRDETFTWQDREFLATPWGELQSLLRQDERFARNSPADESG